MTTPAPKLIRSISMREEAPLEQAVVRTQSSSSEISPAPRQLIRHYTVTQSVNDPLAVVRTSMLSPVQSPMSLTNQLGANPLGSNPLVRSMSVVRMNNSTELS